MTRPVFACCLSLALVFGAAALLTQLWAWFGTMHLPVYAEGGPDADALSDQFGGQANRPYALRQSFSDTRREQDLRAIYLEDKYLKCTVLSNLGSPLCMCVDKLPVRSMSNANTGIETARGNCRGAWTAFGDEFRFPISQKWVSPSPADAKRKSCA